MNLYNTAQPGVDSFADLSARCRNLRLACWRLSPDGEHLVEPQDNGPAGWWLHSNPLRDHIWSLGRDWLNQPEPQPVEMAPGCWVIPARQLKNRRLAWLVMGLTLSPAVFDSKWFKSLCHKIGVEEQSVRDALACYTWPGDVDLPLLRAAFEQTLEDHTHIQNDTVAIDQFSEQLLDSFEQINLLFRLTRLMNSLEDPIDAIPMCCQQILPVLPFRWIAVKFWDSPRNVADLTGRLFIAGELPCPEQRFEEVLFEQLGRRRKSEWTRLLDPSSSRLAELVGSEVIVEQITHDGEVVGVLLAGNKRGSNPMQSDVISGELMFFEATANLMGVFHENIARFDEQRQMFTGTLTALTAAIDAKDEYTRGHSERVAYLAAELAKKMGMAKKEIERIHTTGLVHDVGKIGVPEAVLCKAGKLTEEEFEYIKQHPTIGYHILKGIMLIDPVLPGVLHHHERWDGKGYPHGLSGLDIPLDGRILALADTFDAMSSTRSYRPAMPREKVLEEIRNCSGTQFDPTLAPLFVELDFSGYDAMVARHESESRSAA